MLDVRPLPLPDARPTRVRQHRRPDFAEHLHEAVALDRCADLLRPRGHCEWDFGLDPRLQRLLRHAGRPHHVFVRAVGAGADEPRLELARPAVLPHVLCELRQGVREVRREGAVDVRLQLAEVDLDQLVVFAALIGDEVLPGGDQNRNLSEK